MGSRVLRDGMIDSETIAGLHDRTFRLWTHLLLAADDYGLLEIDYGPVKRSAPMLDWTRETVAKMLGELIDAGLLFPYEVDGKRYAAVARWSARIQSAQPRYPQPPFGMGHVRRNCTFKTDEVRMSASKILNWNNEETSARDAPETLQSTASVSLDTKGLRVKGERIREKGSPFSSNSSEIKNPSRSGKGGLRGETSKQRRQKTPPTTTEVLEFFETENLEGDPLLFHSYNTARNWDLGKLSSWQAAAHLWSDRENNGELSAYASCDCAPWSNEWIDFQFRAGLIKPSAGETYQQIRARLKK